MSALRLRMIQDLKLRNYSPKTVECYVRHVAKFAAYFGRSPDELGPEEIRQYQIYLAEERGVGWSSFNQAVCALRFLYGTTLGRPERIEQIPFTKKPQRLPEILSRQEVESLIACISQPLHRTIVMLMYGTGLRISEALALQVSDIDSKRMVIHVRGGKGNKDRIVPLSRRLLDQLRAYFRTRRPTKLLFASPGSDRPPLPETVGRAIKRAAAQAGIRKTVTCHSMRHCFATHLLEANVDILSIQKTLGHRYLSTTSRYTRVTRQRIEELPSPLDLTSWDPRTRSEDDPDWMSG